MYVVLLEGTIPNLWDRKLVSISDLKGLKYERRQHVECRVLLVRANSSLEEVDHVLVLFVARTIASDIECGRASCVLGELVGPEISVWSTLVNPVLVHCRTVS